MEDKSCCTGMAKPKEWEISGEVQRVTEAPLPDLPEDELKIGQVTPTERS